MTPRSQPPPTAAAALARQRRTRFAIDGEVVGFSGAADKLREAGRRAGWSREGLLLRVRHTSLDGEDVRARPLRERKRLLREAISFDDSIRFTTRRNGVELIYAGKVGTARRP